MKKLCNIFLCGLLFVLPACEKDTSASIFAPEVSTGTASNIYRKGATVSGSIRFAEGMSAERYGILFSGYQSMSQPQELEVSDGSIDFSFQLQGLEMGKTYYFCTYASGGYSTVRGEVRSFTTTDSNAPIFSAPTVIETTHKSVVISSTLLDDGGSEVMLSGFCFNEVGENLPNFIDHVSNVQLSGHTITATITSLAPLKNYQIRAYGASVKGVAYSETVTFGTEKAVVPFLADIVCHSTTWHSLDIESSVLESGSGEVTETGFCFSTTNQRPTLDDLVVSIEADGTSFFTLLDELSPGTTYYVCAYAKNEYGIGYSEVLTCKIPYKDAGNGDINIDDLPTTDW